MTLTLGELYTVPASGAADCARGSRLLSLPVQADGNGVTAHVTVSLDSLRGLLLGVAAAYQDDPETVGRLLEDAAAAEDHRRATVDRAALLDVPECVTEHASCAADAAVDALVDGCGLGDAIVPLGLVQALELADQLHAATRPDKTAIGGAA